MSQDQKLKVQASWFAACTSARTEHFKIAKQDTRFLGLFGVNRNKTQYDEAVAGTGVSQFDVLLSSFGGNDLGFASVIMDCIGVDDAFVGAAQGAAGGWAGALKGAVVGAVSGRCHQGLDAELRTKIDKVVVPNLTKLYDQFYESTTPGALIVVAGYPQVFENPKTSWATVNALTGRCQGMHEDDAYMLRGVAGRLNQAIGAEVDAAAARHTDRIWVFADVSPRFAGHGLCSDEGAQWFNGLTTGLGDGDFRLPRSFHPTQQGHTDGYAHYVSTNKKVRDWRPAELGVDERSPEAFLLGFLAAWWLGDRAAMSAYATPEAIRMFTEQPRSFAKYELGLDNNCLQGSSGLGGCFVDLISAQSASLTYFIGYESIDSHGTLQITEISQARQRTSVSSNAYRSAVSLVRSGTRAKYDDYLSASWDGGSPPTRQSVGPHFQTPSSNITCSGHTDGLLCAIHERTFPDPQSKDCGDISWTPEYIVLTRTQVEQGVCTGGIGYAQKSNALPYGSSLIFGDFGCHSGNNGLTCVSFDAPHGFLLSRSRFEVLD